nr:hypothetical protein [Tanacetum cinerariifolium]
KFRIQQYLQNGHYALWEVIEFGDSYKAPPEETCKGLASESSAKKKGTASLSHDTVCAYMASQLNGFHIKYEDITQIDEDDIEEMDIKWNMALLSMRADRAPRSQDRGKRESYKQGPKEEESAPKALMAIDGIGWDWSYMARCRVKDQIRARRVLDTMQFLPPPAQVYLPPKKDLSWIGLPEFFDDTVTDCSRPTPSIDESKCNISDLQSNNFFVFEHGESLGSIMSKPMIKFVKAADCPRVTKTNNTENARKSTIKYVEMYRNTSKSPKVRGGKRENLAKNNFAHTNVTPRAVLIKTGKTPIAGEDSTIPTEPHHTPSPHEHHSSQHDSPPPSHPTTTSELISQALTEPLTHRQYTRRATRIAQSKALSLATDEPVSLSRDDSQGEAFPTISSLDAGQDRENINKTSALPHESSPRVLSLDADEGSMQQRLHELMEICTSLQSSIEAANILTSEVAAASVSHAAGVPTVSGSFPTVRAIFTTASVVTPYIRRPRWITIGGAHHMRSLIIGAKDKGKQKVVESKVPKKRKLQEQIDAQIARLHAKKELKIMIEGLDRSNEMLTKHLQEYKQAAADLSVGEKIELISELVKYQDHCTKILKYQAQQSKPLSKKEQREFYMSKQLEDFMPMSLKEEGERVKRQGLKIDQGSSKRMKTSKDVSKEDLKGITQLVSLEEVYVKALQVKHPIIDWEIHSEEKRE